MCPVFFLERMVRAFFGFPVPAVRFIFIPFHSIKDTTPIGAKR